MRAWLQRSCQVVLSAAVVAAGTLSACTSSTGGSAPAGAEASEAQTGGGES